MESLLEPLTERERALLAEANHRTANAFQAVLGLLYREASALADPLAAAPLNKAIAQLKAFALLNAMLRPSAITSAGKLEVCAATYLRTLCSHLEQACLAPMSARMTMKLPGPQPVPENVCRSLGLIVTELVMNASKHAFAGRSTGRVRVALQGGKPGGCVLTVADDGAGFREEARLTGGGLSHLERLSRAIGAACHFNTGESGTTVTLTFDPKGPQAFVAGAA